MENKQHRDIEVVEGGESACYAHLLCEECGTVLDGTHVQPCPSISKKVNVDEDVEGDVH